MCNRGAGYGLEIPVDYIFFSHEKGIKWLKNKLEVVENELASNVEHYWKKSCVSSVMFHSETVCCFYF